MSCQMWFGTQNYAGWIDAPLSGASSGAEGWGDDGTYLGGDAYVVQSSNTHKVYIYSWPQSSSREMAQLMQSYRSGTYGRGKLYWVEPTIYDTNVLPAKWADPSITLDYEGPSLVPDVVATSANTSSFSQNRLPIASAQYNLDFVEESPTLNGSNSLFIPIPDGMQLNVGAFYSSTDADAGIYVTPALSGGSQGGSNTRITPKSNTDSSMFSETFTKGSGEAGVYLWIGKDDDVTATVTIAAIHARLSPIGVVPDGPNYWIGGQGHIGCRFVGTPTYITHNGVDGGQIEYAATFREVLA